MLKVSREANKLITFLSNIPERGLSQEEKELLDIEYEFFKKVAKHELKWSYPEDKLEILRTVIQIDDLYFGRK